MLLATFGLASLLPILLVLACPLMMVFMMRGHGHGGHHDGGMKQREQMTLEELKAERDALNEEIGRRATSPHPTRYPTGV